MFKNKRQIVRDFMKDKDWMTFDEIVEGTNLGRTKVKEVLSGLKGKEIEFQDDKFKLVLSPIKQPEQVEDTPNNEDNPLPVQDSAEPKVELPEPEPEMQKKGLNAKMLDIEQKLDIVLGAKKDKEKKGKLKKFSVNKLKRFNKNKTRSVILLGVNRNARLIKAEYLDGNIGLLEINGNYYEGSIAGVWLWEGKQPIYIIPEWSMKPITVEFLKNKVDENKSNIESQIVNLRAVKLLELDSEEGNGSKHKPNIMLWIGAGVLGLVVVWLFMGGKK